LFNSTAGSWSIYYCGELRSSERVYLPGSIELGSICVGIAIGKLDEWVETARKTMTPLYTVCYNANFQANPIPHSLIRIVA
jgi:hypothetical protein